MCAHPRVRSVLCTLLAMCTSAVAMAQQPVIVNGARKAAAGLGVPRSAPRGTIFPHQIRQIGTIDTPANNLPVLLAEDAMQSSGPRRGGVVHPINIDSGRDGQWMPLPQAGRSGGGWLWTARIRAPGAQAVRLHLAPWSPPAGAELIIYNVENET